jgi:poly(hydroxyalkanoate) depolymerase family esterase
MKRVLLLACASACASSGSEPVNVGTTSAALVDVASFGANPAQLTMHKYVPQDMPADPRPLVVVLHGCTQTPQTYEAAGWDQLADAWKFYVLYPQQNTQRNNSGGCFNWGGRWPSAPSTFTLQPEPLDLTEIQRGHGENESIKEMVDKMKADHPIDPKRVFVTGLSGGGAMTALLLAVWPDVFSAGAIFAGVPYACATSQKTTAEAQNCLKDYTGTNAYLSRTPQQWGDLVRAGDQGFSGPYPRVSIWHGTSDFIVNNRNQAELVKQWTNANGIDQTPDATDTVDGFPHKEYKDGNGTTLVETYEITGQSHGTEVAPSKPIDPSNAGGAKCGQAGAYILSTSICSTYHAGKFFGLDQASSGTSSSSGDGTSGTSGGSGVPGTGGSSNGGGSGPSGGAGDTTRSSGGGCTAARAHGAEAAVAAAALLLLLGRRRRRRT